MAKARKKRTTPPASSSSDFFWRSREEWLSGYRPLVESTAVTAKLPAVATTVEPALKPRVVPAAQTTDDTWILLRDAKALGVDAYQSLGQAERALMRGLAAGQVRWRCLELEGWKQSSDPDAGSSEFWEEFDVESRSDFQVILRINWEESWARRGGLGGYVAYRIEVAKPDVLKLLPTRPSSHNDEAATPLVAATPDPAHAETTGVEARKPRKARSAPAVEVAKEALRALFPPDGKAPRELLGWEIVIKVHAWCKDPAHRRTLPGRDSILRRAGPELGRS